MPVDNCDDPMDREAKYITSLMANGDHLNAAARLQIDAQTFRPGQFTALVGEVKGISNATGTLTHLEMTPLPTYDGDPQGRLAVSLVTPALDCNGAQYVDCNGRPMAYIDNVASIDNHGKVMEICPRPVIVQQPIFVERPWLRCDERKPTVRFDIDIILGGRGNDHHRDDHRRDDHHDDHRGPWNRPHVGGGPFYPPNGGRGGNTTIIENNTTIINKTTEVNKTEVNKTVVVPPRRNEVPPQAQAPQVPHREHPEQRDHRNDQARDRQRADQQKDKKDK